VKRFVISLALFALLPASVCADQVVTMPYNYSFKGSITIPSIAAAQCLVTDSNHKVIGQACGGGGGVSSINPGPSNNLTFSPTTGAVIGDIISNPTFVGNVTAAGFTTASFVHASTGIITNDLEAGSLIADNLVNGQCVQAGLGGQLLSSGSPCGAGGGVSSVTSTNSNLSAAPTTGAVVLDFSNSPIFTGLTTTDTLQVNSTSQFNGAMGVTGSVTTGGLADLSISPGECVETTGGSVFVGTGSPCGGGGVTSVSGTANQITVVNGTTTPVVSISNNPTLPGHTTVADFTANGDSALSGDLTINGVLLTNDVVTVNALNANQCVATDGSRRLTSTGSACGGVSSVTSANSLLVASPTTGAVVLTADTTPAFDSVSTDTLQVNSTSNFDADVTVNASVQASDFIDTTLTPNYCVNVGGSSQLTSLPCTQHGNQSITASLGTCVAGTPVVFATPFLSTPDIAGSTSPVVGDTFSPSSITTTGFTPNLCSTASNAAATVYWIATAG